MIDGEAESSSPGPYYAVNFINIWREAMVLRSVRPENYLDYEYCGYRGYNSNYDTQVSYVTEVILGRNANGGLLTLYEASKYFSVSLSQAQANAMLNDPCVYAVEPNYIIRARGTTANTKHLLRVLRRTRNPEDEEADDSQEQEEQAIERHRKLGIPEFNMKDTSPGNWGLERISTRGRRNGKYIWVAEGFGTEVYVFDSGIYRDHSDWIGRNVTFNTLGPTRIEASAICAGEPDDSTDHGTLIASIAGGKKYGTAKMAAIHPIQILDVNGEGSIATFLCGMERLINDGLAFYNANAPKKIRAVVNLSLGVEGKSDILDAAVKDLVDLGYSVVIAAGDSNGNACHYSPTTPTAIRVGALKDTGLMTNGTNPKTSTSNYGECIDMWAPGEAIVGASSTGEYDTTIMSGTSVAAAFVTGATSLFLEEFLTSRRSQYRLPQMVKTKMNTRAERGILGDLGHLSVNRMLQTTSSQCQANWHCVAPKVCLFDGSCGYQTDTPWNTQQV